MRYSVAYDKALEISKDMGDSLLQRLNFFLIGTAFLIAGLATLVASSNNGGLTNGQLALAYIINALGLYLALFFTIVNFLNIEILSDFGKYVRTLEKRLMEEAADAPFTELPPATQAEEIANSKMKCFPWFLLARLFAQIYRVITGPEDVADTGKTNHVYLIPILFVVGWIIIFLLALPRCGGATAVVFGSIGLVPVIYALTYLARYLRWRLQKIPKTLRGKKTK